MHACLCRVMFCVVVLHPTACAALIGISLEEDVSQYPILNSSSIMILISDFHIYSFFLSSHSCSFHTFYLYYYFYFVETLYHFFSMLEDGRLQFHSASPTQLCQVAISYHNLAVVQIKMQASDAACKTSQNARKIARLCLSVSTRYLASFQRTHDAALSDLKYHLEYR